MRTVSALFDKYDQVAAAVDGLSDMGVASGDITVISPNKDAAVKIREAAGLGAAIGGVGGILAGLGVFAIPGLGPVLGVGWLVPVLVGAAAGGVAGGLIGAMTGAGIDEKEAHVYAEGVRRGSTLVAARIHDDEAGEALSVLQRCGAIDTNIRRGEYASDGWESFVPKDIWDDDIGSEDAHSADDDGKRQRFA
jgi:uncharacterized membrane protein